MQYKPSVPFDEVPGSLPSVAVPADVSLEQVQEAAKNALENLNGSVLTDDAVWQDWLSITDRVQTRGGPGPIADLWRQGITSRTPHSFSVQPARINQPFEGLSWVDVPFTFSTTQSDGLEGVCSGTASLTPDSDKSPTSWKVWMLVTILGHFKDQKSPDEPPPQSHAHNARNGSGDYQVSTLVVGAGQAGLSVAGRLAAVGLDYILLERQSFVGNGWIGRYDTVRQHTAREYNNLPFDRTWKESDPDLLPAAAVAEGFENYVKKYDINIWLSSTIESCRWLAEQESWLVTVRSEGEVRRIQARHLVLTMGAAVSIAARPHWPKEDEFFGKVLHAIDYKNSKDWRGKRGIVVGTGTTAHDVAQDMLDAGLSEITMIQRKRTAVYPVDWVLMGQTPLYNLHIPTTMADNILGAMPIKIQREITKRSYKKYIQAKAEKFDAIEKAGFQLDRGGGLLDNLAGRFGGYYIDVGTSDRIASGEIKVKSGVPVENFTQHGLAFADGSSVEGDVVVFATGCDMDYRNQVATIVGDEIASGLTEFWGIDKNGDLRNVMYPDHPGLWLLGGGTSQARYFSRFIALQIQAESLTGIPPAKPMGV